MDIIRKTSLLIVSLLISILLMSCVQTNDPKLVKFAKYSEAPSKRLPVKKVFLAYDDLKIDGVGNDEKSTVEKIYLLLNSDINLVILENQNKSYFKISEEADEVNFEEFLTDKQYRLQRDSAEIYKIYFEGKNWQSISKSWVDDENLTKMKNTLSNILASHNYSIKIELHLIGGGTGAIGLKNLVKTIGEDELLNAFVYLKTACFIAPVMHSKYYTSNDTSAINSYPQILAPDAKVLEIFAANNSSKKLVNTPYKANGKVQWLKQARCPGSHSQVTGVDNDTLSSCALAKGINYISEFGLLDFDAWSLTDTVKLRLYNSIITNPYIVKAMIKEEKYYK